VHLPLEGPSDLLGDMNLDITLLYFILGGIVAQPKEDILIIFQQGSGKYISSNFE
jgi:hypothetical protein